MRLARTLRSNERDGARRPIRPRIDQRQRRGIAGPGKKVLARKAFRMIERERKLTGTRHNLARTRCLRRHSAIVPMILWRPVAGIERTGEVARQREADEHSGARQRHGQQESDEAAKRYPNANSAKITEARQKYRIAAGLARQHIAFEKLADQNDAGDDRDAGPVRSKLRESDAQREDKRGQ